jgi:FemAB-related protein (PEP-CTERM system-associated)
MTTLSIGMLDSARHAAWDEFVQHTPDASFFHRAGWQSVIERAFGHKTWFLYAARGEQISAILPMAEVRSWLFGHTLCALPFCVYGGIAGTDEEACAALDQHAQQLARRLRVDHLEYRHVQRRNPSWAGSALYATFRKPLASLAEQNMAAIPRKQRAMVRKGIAAGLSSEIDSGIERFFSCYAASVHRLGTPVFSRNYFRLLKEVFGDDCELLSVVHEGQPVCAVLSFYFRNEVLPYYGGGGLAARTLAGNDFMYWEVMRRACERGVELFDFGRSKQGTGSFDFKKNWGFDATPLGYEYQLHKARALPERHPLNPKFSLSIRAWRALPLSLANALGPFIVRNLG